MDFVNEKISEADWIKSSLKEVDDNFMGIWCIDNHTWTVDKERNMYLCKIAAGREEISRILTWTFYWQGELIWFKDEVIDYSYTTPCLVHSRLYNFSIPNSIINLKEKIFDDLQSAFLAYGTGGGLPEECMEFILHLDFEY